MHSAWLISLYSTIAYSINSSGRTYSEQLVCSASMALLQVQPIWLIRELLVFVLSGCQYVAAVRIRPVWSWKANSSTVNQFSTPEHWVANQDTVCKYVCIVYVSWLATPVFWCRKWIYNGAVPDLFCILPIYTVYVILTKAYGLASARLTSVSNKLPLLPPAV